MHLRILKSQMLRGSFLRLLLFRAFAFGSVMLVVSIVHITHEVREIEPTLLNNDKCPLDLGFGSGSNSCDYNLIGNSNPLSMWFSGAFQMPCKEIENLTKDVFGELMRKNLLDSNATALSVGSGSAYDLMAFRELGFSNALGVGRHPSFSLRRRRFVYELAYADDSFDFVFSRDLDSASVPALLVLEIERVLRPGGMGAMLVGARHRHLYSGSLIMSATPVSSFLKSSDVVHVCGVGSHALVIFKKRYTLGGHLKLPAECPAMTNNKPFMKFIEPLVDENSMKTVKEAFYLPQFMNISSRERLIYINVGAEESTNLNVSELMKPYHSMPDLAFSVYLIDHNASVLSSHIKNAGITFIYHPGLVENPPSQEMDPDEYLVAPQEDDDYYEYLSAPLDDVGFDFIKWFKETVADNDFVVLRINARTMKYDIIGELIRTGAICHVDELFLRCPENLDCQGSMCGHCLTLLRSLRNNGVFAHEWLGN